ncbi:hypothetical protein KSP40_PGU003726 [Platanthera guangdongensis]|uniref:Uncharacterized protein n=1 Tax=Platanthera guangdongensis TaxID=2320717 RepID=A0ABR2LXT4_9ASPA
METTAKFLLAYFPKYLQFDGFRDLHRLVDLGQALERIEQNDDPKGIFGALLKVSGGLCGEQTLYQDIVELGDDEELASVCVPS